jgi:hypothetical protein
MIRNKILLSKDGSTNSIKEKNTQLIHLIKPYSSTKEILALPFFLKRKKKENIEGYSRLASVL